MVPVGLLHASTRPWSKLAIDPGCTERGRGMKEFSDAAGALVAVALLIVGPSRVEAQDWPTRPIKIVTPLAAGGAADVIGHAVGEAFTAATKLPVIIDNRPGGGGTLAAVTVARAEPDGTTLLLGTAAALHLAPVPAKNFPAPPPPTPPPPPPPLA